MEIDAGQKTFLYKVRELRYKQNNMGRVTKCGVGSGGFPIGRLAPLMEAWPPPHEENP